MRFGNKRRKKKHVRREALGVRRKFKFFEFFYPSRFTPPASRSFRF